MRMRDFTPNKINSYLCFKINVYQSFTGQTLQAGNQCVLHSTSFDNNLLEDGGGSGGGVVNNHSFISALDPICVHLSLTLGDAAGHNLNSQLFYKKNILYTIVNKILSCKNKI